MVTENVVVNIEKKANQPMGPSMGGNKNIINI